METIGHAIFGAYTIVEKGEGERTGLVGRQVEFFSAAPSFKYLPCKYIELSFFLQACNIYLTAKLLLKRSWFVNIA